MDDLVGRVPSDAVYDRETVKELARLYLKWAGRYGLRADVLWAQMLLETAGLTFPRLVEASQYNFAGIKKRHSWNEFATFPTLERGVIAHVIHMCWYVYEEHQGPECNEKYDPRHYEMHDFGGAKRPHHGGVRRLRGLSGTWAEGFDYDRKIARVWNDGV